MYSKYSYNGKFSWLKMIQKQYRIPNFIPSVVSLANMRAWCWGLFLRLLSFCLILAVSAPLAQKALEGLLGSGVPVTAYVVSVP